MLKNLSKLVGLYQEFEIDLDMTYREFLIQKEKNTIDIENSIEYQFFNFFTKTKVPQLFYYKEIDNYNFELIPIVNYNKSKSQQYLVEYKTEEEKVKLMVKVFGDRILSIFLGVIFSIFIAVIVVTFIDFTQKPLLVELNTFLSKVHAPNVIVSFFGLTILFNLIALYKSYRQYNIHHKNILVREFANWELQAIKKRETN